MTKRKIDKKKVLKRQDLVRPPRDHKETFDQLLDDAIFGVKKKPKRG